MRSLRWDRDRYIENMARLRRGDFLQRRTGKPVNRRRSDLSRVYPTARRRCADLVVDRSTACAVARSDVTPLAIVMVGARVFTAPPAMACTARSRDDCIVPERRTAALCGGTGCPCSKVERLAHPAVRSPCSPGRQHGECAFAAQVGSAYKAQSTTEVGYCTTAPVQRARKFSHVFGTTSCRSSISMRPASCPPVSISGSGLRLNPSVARRALAAPMLTSRNTASCPRAPFLSSTRCCAPVR